MLHHVNAEGTIDPGRGMHYRFHRRVDPSIYPQVHDFYELTLVTGGEAVQTINGEDRKTGAGTLVLIRPGDIHGRRALGEYSHINVAFPAAVIADMFRYLGDPEGQARLLAGERPPLVRLDPRERLRLQARLEALNLLPVDRPMAVQAALRRLMLDVMLDYILPALARDAPAKRSCPRWLSALLETMEDPEHLCWDLEALAAAGGCSKEHLCRSFRKYLDVTPTAYLRARRLNYAANLLRHSDQKVIDVAYAAGFQSLSRFYHAFKAEFGVSPRTYREKGG